jgi:hypothetical protein
MEEYWMFGGVGRDLMVAVKDAGNIPADIRGEEFVWCDAEEAARLAAVPAAFRWEAAQGEGWSPSPKFAEWRLTASPEV